MSNRYQLFGIIFCFLFLTYVSYKMGQADQPPISYELAYEIVKNKNSVNSTHEPIEFTEEMFSYVPAYSHIYVSEGNPQRLAINLSLRNVDSVNSIKISKVSYFNTQGQLIRNYLSEGYKLAPLETKEIFIKGSDLEGGSGANFMIYYSVRPLTQPPIFESVMSGETEQHSYMFTSRGENYYQKETSSNSSSKKL